MSGTKRGTDLTHTHFLEAAIVGVVPIPLGWLAVYGLIWLVRWVRRGTLFTLGVASHNEENPPVGIAAIIVATLLVVRQNRTRDPA